jgi:Ti-type conjugative transfer relaxase TraA
LAIYHFTAKIVSRNAGRSVVTAAAYRAGERIQEHSTGNTYDFTHKQGVEHTEILAPDNAPDWVYNRSELWNAVDKVEKRKDAQLARDLEIALPIELDPTAQAELLRDFVRRHFVSKGMVADLAIHRDNPNNPHAHVLLTLRSIDKSGFGPKERTWNTRASLQAWRIGWAEMANEHLARAGLSVRIDHRTLQAQQLDLIPGRKIGVSLERQRSPDLPLRIAERVAEQDVIARDNGVRIVADPKIAIKALTHYQATFTEHDIAKFLHTRTEGAEQFQDAFLKVTTSPELVALGRDDRGRQRYTSREMLELEKRMLGQAESMATRSGHGVRDRRAAAAIDRADLSAEQTAAFEHLVSSGDLKALVGVADSGKSRLLSIARQAWEAEGYTVKGAALSGIAAESLSLSSGISARTLASYELAWKGDRDPLTSNDVLVIDEAGMLGTQQLARVLDVAAAARAKVVLVGDPEQLQAIEAGAAFRGIIGEVGAVELQEVRRQVHPWQQSATRQLSTGATAEALAAYESRGGLVQRATRDAARSALIDQWARDAQEKPTESRLIFTYTRDEAWKLNQLARAVRRERGELGREEAIETERGMREFATGDRLYFLRNEKSLGVKNGTLGTIQHLQGGVMEVKLDSTGDLVTVDTRFYRDLDHGYAATTHKGQGVTVDRSYILATSYFNRHATYVALSRHRQEAKVFYAAEDFGAATQDPQAILSREARRQFLDVLSRARPKTLAHDYLDHDAGHEGVEERQPFTDPADQSLGASATPSNQPKIPGRASMADIDALQQRAAERWRDKQLRRAPGSPARPRVPLEQRADLQRDSPGNADPQRRREHTYKGPEDEFEL